MVEGIEEAQPARGVLSALAAAEAIVVAPSNPYVSIGPIVAVREIREALEGRGRALYRRQPARGRQGGQGTGRPYALAHGRRHYAGSCRGPATRV